MKMDGCASFDLCLYCMLKDMNVELWKCERIWINRDFMPQIAVQVPLWLYVSLEKRRKCTISCLDWMPVDESLLTCSCLHFA